MSNSTQSDILGPFLCHPAQNSMGFWFSFGPGAIPAKIEVEIEVSGKNPLTVPVEKISGLNEFNVYVGKSETKLEPGKTYRYSVKIDGKIWLPHKFSVEDLTFKTMPAEGSSGAFGFALLSCHGIEAYEQEPGHDKKNTWNMWDRLLKEVQGNPEIQIGILGGDQVYMDDTFGEDLKKFDEKNLADAKARIFAAYFKYWENLSYRKVMARLPCLLMWDDHDLIDGWGSREEAIRSPEVWNAYGKTLTAAFLEMQACRNPGTIDEPSGFSFNFKIADKTFVGLDLRSGRRILENHKSTMMSDDHRKRVEESLATIPGSTKHLFLLSPVTVARMGGSIERALGGMANFLWSLGSRISYGKPGRRATLWGVVFSFLYLGLHFDTAPLPGLVQSVFLTALSVFLLFNVGNVKQYFPNQASKIQAGFYGLLAYALFGIGLALYIGYRWADRPLDEVLVTSLSRAVPIAWDRIWIGLSLGIVGLIGICVGKLYSKPWLKWIGFFILSLFTAFNLWLGLPGWKLHFFSPLNWITYILLGAFTLSCYGLSLLEGMGVIDKIAGLDDDIRDGWSSESNAADLGWLSKQIIALKNRGVGAIYLLCGDIHTGGLSTLLFSSGQTTVTVPQVTSSPMSYVTMPHLVEKLTTGTGEVCLKDGGVTVCTVSNVFYRSNRNFAILRIASGDKVKVEFHFEDLTSPVSVNI